MIITNTAIHIIIVLIVFIKPHVLYYKPHALHPTGSVTSKPHALYSPKPHALYSLRGASHLRNATRSSSVVRAAV